MEAGKCDIPAPNLGSYGTDIIFLEASHHETSRHYVP